MMDSFPPTFKWIVPRTSMAMWDSGFSHGRKAYLIQATVTEVALSGASYWGNLLWWIIIWQFSYFQRHIQEKSKQLHFYHSPESGTLLSIKKAEDVGPGKLLHHIVSTYEPQREKTYPLTCAPTEDSNQPAHPRSLIRAFVVRMKKLCILGYPKSAQRRFRSDCANAQSDLNLRWAHVSEGTFSDVTDHIV